MKGGSAAGGGRLSRIVKAPLRVLRRARDLYVSSMTGCAGRVGGGGGFVGYPGSAVDGFPRSYSCTSRASSSGEEDLRELIRAASQGSTGSLNRGGRLGKFPGDDGTLVVPRSQSVAIGRIDEDKPCDFGADYAMAGPFYPRSRSCAVSKRKVGVGALVGT